jgi:hypothetical protein
MIFLKQLIPLTALAGLAACASGTSMSETPGAMAALGSNESQIVVYRTGIFGAAIQPLVQVDGAETGRCAPNGVFTANVAPGEHTVAISTEVTRSVVVEVAGGETAYVKCSIGLGLLVGQPHLDLVESSFGRGESAGLVLTGSH